MSGANVPYHLRVNKSIKRQLFLDILDFVRLWNGPCNYAYASMGGRFQEDFKTINDRFAIEKMVCVEIDNTTSNRQKFNLPLGFIECKRMSSGDFIVDFERLMPTEETDMRVIVWLDYAEANQRGKQLQEYQELLPKLAPGDVVKITLNANPYSYRKRQEFEHDKDFLEITGRHRLDDLGDYTEKTELTIKDIRPDNYASLLVQSIKNAALKGIQASGAIMPLGAYRYRDGEHQMLTVTAIITDEELIKRIESDVVFKSWPFRSEKWDCVHEVNVPDMSLKERLHINGLLTTDSEDNIHKLLTFKFDKNENKSICCLKNYIQHYRRYPNFGRFHS